MQGPNNQNQIDGNKMKYMDDKGGNGYGGSGSYQQKKCGDKKNKKYRKLAKAGIIADGVGYNWFTYNPPSSTTPRNDINLLSCCAHIPRHECYR